MFEVDVYYFWWLSMALYPIHSIQEGMPLGSVASHLGLARDALEVHPLVAEVLPDTAEKMRELVDVINKMGIPRTPNEIAPPPDRYVTPWEATTVINLANTIGSTLRTESGHRYIIGVRDQRCFSSYTLVERIESCFSPGAWKKMTEDARREFKESGRCLALERYTAAGFHSLRGVESTIRQWIELVTGGLPRKRDWGTYVDALRQNAADPKVVEVIDSIRSLDRNPLMHPEDWLEIDDAVGIFNLSHTCIARLVSDLEKKGKV